MQRYLKLLRRRDYRLLWVGATVSALGDGMSFVALIWLVFTHGGDSAMVSIFAAAYTAPVVIGGLLAGLILDRFDRRRVLAADNVIRGAVIASIPIAALAGALTMAHLFIAAAVYGLLFMTSLAGIPSLIPSLVDEEDLTTANAMETFTWGIAGLAGPAVAGLVVAAVGAPAVLAIDAATYGVFVACLLAMSSPTEAAHVSGQSPTATDPAPAVGLAPAVRFVLATPAILAITAMYMAVNVGEGMFIVLAPVYARDVLGGDASTYGLLLSAFTGGTLLGAIIVGGLDWRWPLGRSIAGATLVSGLAFALLLVRPSLIPAALILAVAGLLASSLTAWAQTIRMRLIPAPLRGRVFALLRTLIQSTSPIGAIVAGLVLASGDPVPAILVMALFMVVPGAIGLFAPALDRHATAEPARTRAT